MIAACAPGTRIVLTYNQPHAALNDLAKEVETTIRRFANESGEPFVSLFSSAEIEELLKQMALRDHPLRSRRSHPRHFLGEATFASAEPAPDQATVVGKRT